MTTPAEPPSGVQRFRKRPVVIEAQQWTGDNCEAVFGFLGIDWMGECEVPCTERELVIETLEGAITASRGDWIIKGVQGEFYPCKPDIFEATYEAVEPSASDRTEMPRVSDLT